jgi:hypothetical protein
MNKRLLHLFNKAGFHQPEMERLGIEHKFEKFAELLVAECIEVFSKDMPDPTSPDYQLGTLNEVVDRVCNVAEHFGVEK